MTIPGRGDLSPRRKHRNWRRRGAAAIVVVVVLGAGYLGYRHFRGGSAASASALLPCPSTTPAESSSLQPKLVVKNATLTTGLAADVAKQLRQRRFRIASVGNTLFRGKGVATIQYSADRTTSAQLLAAQFDGATLEEVSGSEVLEVDIGPRFRALVPAAQAQTAEQAILASPSSTPTPTPRVSPACASSRPSSTP